MMRALITLFGFMMLASSAEAQVYSRDRVSIQVSPAFPEAETPLSLKVDSSTLDLTQLFVRWFVNGKLVSEGEGIVNAAAETGRLGSKTSIEVEVTDSTGTRLSALRTIRPAEVDIVWESDAYVPPFYRGKKLAGPETHIIAEALPRLVGSDGSLIPTKDIIFTWRKNDAVISAASGRGRAIATFAAPDLFASDMLSVEATSLDGSTAAAAQVFIPSVDPFVILYRDHPIFGVLFHQALAAESSVPDTEASFVVSPFFVNAVNADDPRLRYSWSVNGAAIPVDTTSPSRITINAENSSAIARIVLSLTHTANYVLDARGAWRLNFNTQLSGIDQGLFARPQQ